MHRPSTFCDDGLGGAMSETGRAGERRGHAMIEDITYAGPDGSTVAAYLITPSSTGSPADPSVRRAGVMFWHWFDPKAPDGDRTQFVEEAVQLAGDGVVSLLPQGRFPWASDPSGAAHDGPAIEAEVHASARASICSPPTRAWIPG